jgi:hypothetical protein
VNTISALLSKRSTLLPKSRKEDSGDRIALYAPFGCRNLILWDGVEILKSDLLLDKDFKLDFHTYLLSSAAHKIFLDLNTKWSFIM